MRRLLLALSLATIFAPLTAARAQVSIGVNVPGVSIGINLNAYPTLVRVPGYPVYYDPRGDSNYFFYDGQYWVYRQDNWYASSWYNGPWISVQPAYVPLFVLRVPVRYYRQPPTYFRGWQADAPPRWGDHWGRDWERSRAGWNQWNRNAVPRPAPLPVYQRQYAGDRYPGSYDQQRDIRTRNYSYQPRETITRQHYQQRDVQWSGSGPRGGPNTFNPGQDSRNRSQDNDRGNRPVSQGDDRGGRPAPQGDDRGNRPAPQGDDRGNRSAPQGDPRSNRSPPQGDVLGNRVGSQDDNRGNRPESQGDNRGNRPESQGDDRGNRSGSQGDDRGNRSGSQGDDRGNKSQGDDRGNRQESQGKGRDKKD